MKEKLLGSWRLKSWTACDNKGNSLYPLGTKARGIIMYSDDGYMSAMIINPDRVKTISEGISLQAMLSGNGSYLSYSGPYTVKGNVALHHVEISSTPEFIGTTQERFFKINGNTLTINSETPSANGSIVKHTLVWIRTDFV